MTSKRTRKRYRIPPQSNEVHPLAHHGEVSKPLLITIITVGILIGISLLLFFSGQFVGQAIQTVAAPANQGGIFIEGFADAGSATVIPIVANLGTEKSVAVEFELNYNPALTVSCDDIFSSLDANFFAKGLHITRDNPVCGGGRVVFSYTGVCDEGCTNALTGSVEVAQVSFTGAEDGEYPMTFDSFSAINLADGSDIVGDGTGSTLTVGQGGTPPPPPPQQNDGGGSSGGRGGACFSQWQCSTWSVCGNTLEQSRTCTDISRCRRPDRIETQACETCMESWVCEPWTACQNGQQSRTCADQTQCGTVALKPSLTRSCTDAATGTLPAQTIPERQPRAPVLQEPSPSFWDEFKVWIISVPLALILIVVIIILVIRHMHPHDQKQEHYGQLKQWIAKERQLGQTDADIRHILATQTAWHESDINAVFGQMGPNPAQQFQMPQ